MEQKDLHEEFEELMSLFLFGETGSEEDKRLNEIITLHPDLKKRYENYVKTQAGLKQHKIGLEQILIESSTPKTSLFQGNFRNQFLAIAAIISLIVSLSLIFKSETFRKTEPIPMEVTGNCNPESLRSDWVRLDSNSFCDVRINGKLHFRVFPNSEIRVLNLAQSVQEAESQGYQLSIFLQKGKFLLNETLTDVEGKTKIYLSGTEIRLTGTKVWIENSEDRYKVNVWDGSAEVRSGVRYLLPFLLDKQKEEFVKHSLDVQTANDPEQKAKYERIWNDISSEKLSNSSLETKSLFFQKDSAQNPLLVLNEKQTNPKETFVLLEEMQKTIVDSVSQKKTVSLEKHNIEELENFANRIENFKSVEPPKEETKDIESISPNSKIDKKIVPKTEPKKEEPVRLGNKTIKLKDGVELKGNLIQYEDRYIIEVEGKKRVIPSKDVESISF
ncbi:hypothetical protein [Leptospira alstonii]|uniref:FecR protein domain-containing protein n=2 Tax=Leptospira alstonii TaxID=28452 RepID=M6DAI6_9LEPT|nr:hypothetical protein [Leptospira alstonii]EMJ98298.1 hypothetical protein LEP1GSC194_0913 [Leptospira alstonii serovar Sichuan str. 79601]EQA82445.1 hypothetical protein LEP1GSC193_1247 [Leptospira alstonii serovar Pingchang str. 80-412]